MQLKTSLLPFFAVLGLMLRTPASGADDVARFAQDITVKPGESVGDAMCFFCSIRAQGTIEGDAVTIGGTIEIESGLEGDAVAAGGGIRLGPGAKVNGDVVAAGGELRRDPRASVARDAVSAPWFFLPGQRHLGLRAVVLFLVLSVGLALVTALVSGQRRLEVTASALRARPGWVLLAGLVALALWTALCVVSNYLGRAQPVLAVSASALLLISAIVGYTGLSYGLGSRFARPGSHLLSALVGSFLIALIQLVPIAGFFTFLGLSWLALGVATLSGYGSLPDWLLRRFTLQPLAPPAPPSTG